MPQRTSSRQVLAIDIGGSKLAAAVVADNGFVLRRGEVPTPEAPRSDGERVADALLGLIDRTAAGMRPAAVGVASAGPLNVPAGLVSPVNIPAWRDFPLLKRIRRVLPETPAVLLGDAVAAALGEHWHGAGRGATALLGIVVSTGVGGGLVLNGAPFAGPTGNAGHIGHIVTDPAGEPCACGNRGCVETQASGPAMVRWAIARGWTGSDARDLAASARAGEPTAILAFERAAAALGTALITAATLCDLDQVVVGGGVSAAGEVLLGPLRRRVAAGASLPFVRRLQVTAAALGRDAGLIGAARQALRTANSAA